MSTPNSVLEIRVHGVSGTPPEAMLGVPAGEVGQVAGDTMTGFYRARDRDSGTGPRLPATGAREAYSWGALTSSAGSQLSWLRRALWLTLFPFALVNVALWSRPGFAVGTRRRFFSAALVRLAGLLLTALLIATVAGIGVDLVAWQCFRGGNVNCTNLPQWMGFLASDPWDEPARRLALGSLLPLAVLIGLYVLTSLSVRKYESFKGPAPTSSPSEHLLADDNMWRGEQRTKSLRNLHSSFGLAVVIAATAVPMWDLTEKDAFWWTVFAAGVIALLAAISIIAGVHDQVEYSDPGRTWLRHTLPVVLIIIAGIGFLAHFVHLMAWYHKVPENDVLYGYGAIPTLILLALFAAAAMLVGVSRRGWWPVTIVIPGAPGCLVYYRQNPDELLRFRWLAFVLLASALVGMRWNHLRRAPSQAWGGAAPAVLIGAAILVAVLYSTSVTLVVADYLNGGLDVTELGVTRDEGGTWFETQLPKGAEHTGPGDLRTTGDARISDGWLDFTEMGATLRGGELRVGSLKRLTDDTFVPVPSSGLAGGELRLSTDSMNLANTCVTGAGRTDRPASSGTLLLPAKVLQVDAGDGDDAKVPEVCSDVPEMPVRVSVDVEPVEDLYVPNIYVWFSTVLPLFVVVVAVFAIVLIRWFYWKAGGDIRQTACSDFKGFPEYVKRATAKRKVAALAHRGETSVGVISGLAVVAAILAISGSLTSKPPLELAPGLGWLRVVTNIGLWASVALAIALLAIGAKMRTSASIRRAIGVFWDLATFWPRAAHPFGPPCYGERVVPELCSRVIWGAKDGKVILSGHSQGAIISVAVLFQLAGEDFFGRLFFISYGSQLRSWFGRIFPDMLGPAVLGHAATTRTTFSSAAPDAPPGTEAGYVAPSGTFADLLRVDIDNKDGQRWFSLFRRTDPLGFRVYQDGDLYNPVDQYTPELPEPYDVDLAAKVETHSAYPSTCEYRRIVGEWLGSPPDEVANEGVATVPFFAPHGQPVCPPPNVDEGQDIVAGQGPTWLIYMVALTLEGCRRTVQSVARRLTSWTGDG